MEQYISKSALVAEIERLKKNEGWCQVGKDTADVYYARGFRFACERIISFIDTLEVKEVDFDAEWKRYFKHRGEMATVNVHHLAKHFFELGMSVSNKTQKGE